MDLHEGLTPVAYRYLYAQRHGPAVAAYWYGRLLRAMHGGEAPDIGTVVKWTEMLEEAQQTVQGGLE